MKTNEEYELAYREARAVLHRRGKKIEAPYADENGLRFCRVDGRSLSDRELFREAWDDRIADELLASVSRKVIRAG